MTIQNLDTHPKRFVTPKEYADYLDIHWRTVYGYIERGLLSAVRIGTIYKIPIDEARRFASRSVSVR